MKTRQSIIAVALLALAAINSPLSTVRAQTTAFTYQGRLDDNGAPASGLYDFRFKLATDNLGNAYAGNAYLTNAIPVTNGLFTTTIDFGAAVFTGTNYWLEVDVRTNNPADTLGYTALAPLQPVASTPYATFANAASNVIGTVSAAQLTGPIAAAQLSGTYSGAVNLDNAGNSFTGNGASVADVDAAALNGLNAAAFWQLGGNTVAPGQFLGSTNNQPIELDVNGLRALRLEFGGVSSLSGSSALTGAPNVIGGSPVNFVASGVVGAVIGGGGATNYEGSSLTNSIGAFSDFSIIGGGYNNTIQTNSAYSVISGGIYNTIQTNAGTSVIAGGYYNTIQSDSYYSIISGGFDNDIQTNSAYSVISGGPDNSIEANSPESTIGGGYYNNILNNSYEATISGGYDNFIETNSPYSFIGGGLNNVIYGDNLNYGTSVIGGGDGDVIYSGSFNSTIGGGQNDSIGANSDHAFIGGGLNNIIMDNDYEGVISGGWSNSIDNLSGYSFIGGGKYNSIQEDSANSIITGGSGNVILYDCPQGTIAGGLNNTIGLDYDVTNAFVAGGSSNDADGNNVFVAGQNALAVNNNAFVWGDGSAATLSVANDSVTFRASGGYRLITGNGTSGAQLLPNATSWTTLSDRNAKKDFASVDYQGVLDKLAQVPIEQWHYKWEKDSDTLNIGPMAQDFKHAFYPGRDDKGISTLEFDGVELAAIQGLNQKLNARDTEIQNLEKQLSELQAAVKSLAEKK